MFAPYKRDTNEILMKCFEFDWECSKIPKIIKDEEDRKHAKEILWKHYWQIRETYKFFASISPINDVPCMGQLMLQEILNGTKCCDNQYLKLADADVEFISTNAGDKGNKLNPEWGLVWY